eukprot:scaffold129703_cov33-Phaeocystis_antarctica.AAC.1
MDGDGEIDSALALPIALPPTLTLTLDPNPKPTVPLTRRDRLFRVRAHHDRGRHHLPHARRQDR